MKKVAFLSLVLAAVTGGFYFYKSGRPHPRRSSRLPFSRGDIVESVSATGTLEAVETVEVGARSPAWFASSMPTSIRSFARGR